MASEALSLYPQEKEFLQPTLTDGKGASIPPNAGTTWVSADSTKVNVTRVLADGYTGEIQAVGTIGQSTTVTGTDPVSGLTTVVTVTIVSNIALSVGATTSGELKPVRERPTIGPPG